MKKPVIQISSQIKKLVTYNNYNDLVEKILKYKRNDTERK